MADLVVESLSGPVQSVSEACIANNVDVEVAIEVEGAEGLGRRPEVDIGGVVGMNGAREAEMLNGQFAIAGVVGTVLWEVLSGKGLLHLFGL